MKRATVCEAASEFFKARRHSEEKARKRRRDALELRKRVKAANQRVRRALAAQPASSCLIGIEEHW